MLVGTIFENTKRPLRQWFRVMHMVLTSKKGISALQVQRLVGFGSYETALANTKREAIEGFVPEVVSDRVSLLSTDEHRSYSRLFADYRHEFVRHAHGEYVDSAVFTNTIEGFWSIVKRGIVDTFDKVSAKYLPLYVNEFEFRYNSRMNRTFSARISAPADRVDSPEK